MAKANFKTKVVEYKADKKKSAFVKISPCNCESNRVVDLYKWGFARGSQKGDPRFCFKAVYFQLLSRANTFRRRKPSFRQPNKNSARLICRPRSSRSA